MRFLLKFSSSRNLSFIALINALILAPTFSKSQTFQEYLALRKKHGISQATGVEALQTFIGKRILEVSGEVKGTLRVDSSCLLLVATPDGGELQIEAPKAPDWLQTGNVRTRLLIEGRRENEYGFLHARLLGVVTEDQMERYEASLKPRNTKLNSSGIPKNLPTPSQKQAHNWQLPVSDALPYYAAFIKKRNKKLTDRQVWEIAKGIIGFSLRYGVDARLIMALVLVESNYNPYDTSHSGAMGLGQLMPGTAKGMGVSDAYDTNENLYATVRLVRGHLEKYRKDTGDPFEALVLALAAYNAGSGAVRRHGGVPPYRETQNYIRKVIAAYRQFAGQ